MINRNPLGIRKVDYQAERREYGDQVRDFLVPELIAGWDRFARQPLDLTVDQEVEVIRMLNIAHRRGWEAGVKTGVEATKSRVKESLDNGTLVRAGR